MKVHSELGNGFPEINYHRAMIIEMKEQGLKFESEKHIPVFYKNEKVGSRRADFFVEEAIMVEIKALSKLDDSNLNQAINHLEAFNLEIGLLINFGAKSLEFKRVINSKLKPQSNQSNQRNQ